MALYPRKKLSSFERIYYILVRLDYILKKSGRREHSKYLKDYIDSDDLFSMVLKYTYEPLFSYTFNKIDNLYLIKEKDNSKIDDIIKDIFFILDELREYNVEIGYEYDKNLKNKIEVLANLIPYGYELVNMILKKSCNSGINRATLNKVSKDLITNCYFSKFGYQTKFEFIKYPVYALNKTKNVNHKILVYVDIKNDNIFSFKRNFKKTDFLPDLILEEIKGLIDIKDYDEKYEDFFKKPFILDLDVYYKDRRILKQNSIRCLDKNSNELEFIVFNIIKLEDFKNKKDSLTYHESLLNPIRKKFKYLKNYKHVFLETQRDVVEYGKDKENFFIASCNKKWKFGNNMHFMWITKFNFCYLNICDVKVTSKSKYVFVSSKDDIIKHRFIFKHNENQISESDIGKSVRIYFYKVGKVNKKDERSLISPFFDSICEFKAEPYNEIVSRSSEIINDKKYKPMRKENQWTLRKKPNLRKSHKKNPYQKMKDLGITRKQQAMNKTGMK